MVSGAVGRAPEGEPCGRPSAAVAGTWEREVT
jgi:hypothetical protein